MSWIDDNQSEINEAYGQYPNGEKVTPQEKLEEIEDTKVQYIEGKDIEWLISRVKELEDALHKLEREAAGFLSMADKESHGYTNMQVLQHWIDNACKTLRGEE